MPATVIAERVGWDRSIRVLSGRVAELRPAYLPPGPAARTAYAAGEIAQCDFWFPDIELPAGFGQVRMAKRRRLRVTKVSGQAELYVVWRPVEAVKMIEEAGRGCEQSSG